jgi:HD-GYP domain-containing protein (c-di-GMP phosphodiesterase class II)
VNGLVAEKVEQPTGGQPGQRVLLTVAEILERHHAELALHGEVVGHYSSLVARQFGLSAEHADRIRIAAALHDIGKIGLPHRVLAKAAPLSAAEWGLVHTHPAIGAQLLRSAGLEDVAGWVLAHHERPDGLGYPEGLFGSEIPLEARILTVTDAYDAMTSRRPYRVAMSHGQAAAELRRGAGSSFDREVVEAFLDCPV